MNTTNTTTVTAAPDQFEFHANPTPGFSCDICGCPAKVRAQHRALRASELGMFGGRATYVKKVKVCFGQDVDIRAI